MPAPAQYDCPKSCLLSSTTPSLCFYTNTPTTDLYTLSLHDALPICRCVRPRARRPSAPWCCATRARRSEEHTSELQSLRHLVCRLLLEKKKKLIDNRPT